MDLPKDIKYLIFDLDGTLANFPIDYTKMRNKIKKLFSKYELQSDFKPIIPEIKRLSKNIEKNIEEKAYKIIDKYEKKSVRKSTPNIKLINLYKNYHKKNKYIFIMTRNGEAMVLDFLKKYKLPNPNLISSRNNCINLKPNEEQFNIIYEKFKDKKSKYLLIGDSFHDEELAKRVGIKFNMIKMP